MLDFSLLAMSVGHELTQINVLVTRKEIQCGGHNNRFV